MAWLTGWNYRKPITVSNGSADYQTKVLVGESSGAVGEEVDCGAKCQTDFDDLRFTGSDGITLLDYWIESISGTTPNQLATVWVQNDATPSTTGYMYYGKADATAVSSGANTFLFFDDFSTAWNNPVKWTGDTTYGSVSGGILTYTGVTGESKSISGNVAVAGDIAVRFRATLTNADYSLIGVYDGTGYIYATHSAAYANHSLWRCNNGGDTVISESAIGFDAYHLFDFCRILTGTDTVRVFYDNVQVGSDTTTQVCTGSIYPWIRAVYAVTDLVDWVLTRKYAATEQTFVFGAEEQTTSGFWFFIM